MQEEGKKNKSLAESGLHIFLDKSKGWESSYGHSSREGCVTIENKVRDCLFITILASTF